MNTATVIGLGNMGTTLARLLLRAGYRVTVWNRSRDKAAALLQEGARLADSPAGAVNASPLVIICVLDYAATRAILSHPDVEAALASRTLVQLTTGSPREARELEAWAHGHGARYLDGAIQAAPAEMGQPGTTILVSGARSAYELVVPTLALFGGGLTYLGEAIGAAGTMDLATLSYVYGASLGFFHGARIIEHEGFAVENYGDIVEKITPAFGTFFKYEAGVIKSGDFRVTASPMSISIEATERILAATREAGIPDDIPAFIARFFQRAKAAGYQNEEAAALIKLLREKPTPPVA
ncbi:MAG TPA: NAD(P)-dependent oxidoreductase [Opitutaceae bacterium]